MSPEQDQLYWTTLTNWIEQNQIGDLASIIGVIVSLIGFMVMLVGVLKSKGAAQRAEEAARSTQDSMQLFETVVDFSAAISALDEIKRLHRQEHWVIMPDRYAAIRKLLITLKSSSTDLSDEQLSLVQQALVNLHTIESAVDKSISEGTTLKSFKLNAIIALDIDNLIEILSELKSAKGVG